MKRLLTHGSMVVLVLAALLCAAGTVWAQNPHFVSASATTSGVDLVVSFKEAGLGDNVLITYEADADGSATYVCINGGGNHPKAANKENVAGPVSATGTFSSGKNGSISQSLTLEPPGPGTFSCPSGQVLVIACAKYTNVSITDTTNGLTEDISGTFTASDKQFGQFCAL